MQSFLLRKAGLPILAEFLGGLGLRLELRRSGV